MFATVEAESKPVNTIDGNFGSGYARYMPLITISGDRQTGKTDLLLTIGARDAAAGKHVVYLSDARTSMEAFKVFEKLVEGNEYLEKAYCAAGDQHYRFITGGRIDFVIIGRGGAVPDRIDTWLFDDVTLSTSFQPQPEARVYQTVTTDA